MGRKSIAKDGVRTRFTSENQPEGRGRKEGSKNRSTVLNKWLTVPTEILNPITRDKEKGTVEDEVILALVTKARKGDVSAIKEILDTMYGKLTEKQEHLGKDGEAFEIVVKHVTGSTQAS